MFQSIRAALGLLFLTFVLLVSITVGATFWGLNAQKQDALVINLAGRQRMLVQQMTRFALEIRSGEVEHIPDLQDSMATFASTLAAFQSGGEVPYLPGRSVYVAATRNPIIREQLDRVAMTWSPFEAALIQVTKSPPDSEAFRQAMQQVETLAPLLVEQADAAVRLYESASTNKVERLRWIQGIFLAVALLLLAMGLWMVRRMLLEPLTQLETAAERIGQGDLNTPVAVQGPQEIHTLATTIESMRAQLRTSQEKLLEWGQQLEARVAQRTRELEALNRVSREISSRLDLDHVLRTITEKARELLNSDAAVLCLLDSENEFLRLQSISGPVEAIEAYQSSSRDQETRTLLYSPTAQLCTQGECGPACHILAQTYRVSHLVAPLQAKGQVIGALCVGSTRQAEFSAEDVDLITRLANSAAIALENARLYRQAERLAAMEERQRIAAEMHDGLAQTLSSIGLLSDRSMDLLAQQDLPAARHTLQRLREAASSAIREVRRAIASLQTDAPPPRALQDELQALITRYQDQSAAEIDFHCRVYSPVQLPEDDLQQVLRVVEEALRNAIRHSEASQITVELFRDGQEYSLLVHDDGRGFDPEHIPHNHFGLQIMQARAARLDGHLTVESQPGEGTCVTLAWPAHAGVLVEVV